MGLGLLREPPVGSELCLQRQGPPSLSTTAPGNVTAEQGVGLEGGGHQAGVGEGSCQPHLRPRGASGGRCRPAVEKGSSGRCRAPPSPECGIGGVPMGSTVCKRDFSIPILPPALPAGGKALLCPWLWGGSCSSSSWCVVKGAGNNRTPLGRGQLQFWGFAVGWQGGRVSPRAVGDTGGGGCSESHPPAQPLMPRG